MTLRILHVAPSIARAYGGPTHSLAAYARAAALHGCTCTVAAPHAPSADVAHFQHGAPDVSLQLFPSRGRGAAVWSPALVRFLRTHAANYDVVHVHGLLNGVSSLAARCCRRIGQPAVIRPFGTMSRYTFQHRRRALKRVYHRAVDAPNLRAAALHFTTDAERDEACWLGIDLSARAFVIPPPAFDLDAAVATPSTDGERPTALMVSRLDPVKNIELLLDAWALVRARRADAHLVIAGDGPPRYRRALAARAAALGVADGVAFVGYADAAQKRALYAAADLFVLPSKHENFGMSALEALAAGLPAIVSREVQLSAFVDANQLGRVVTAAPRDLAEALLGAWTNPEWRRACAARAPGAVRDAFSPAVIGPALRDMYGRVCAMAGHA